MLRQLSLLAVPAALVLGLATGATQAGGSGGTPCVDSIKRQPTVIYNISGGTLTGTIQTTLLVYNDGTAIYAKDNFTVFQTQGVDESVSVVGVGQAADQLLRDLAQAGAFSLCDQQIQVSDVPLTTLSVSRGTTDSPTHTASWWIGNNQVTQVLNNFITTHFPAA